MKPLNEHLKRSVKSLLVYDPTPFAGGSKVATNTLLAQSTYTASQSASSIPADAAVSHRLFIATQDPKSWTQQSGKITTLYLPSCLKRASHGVPYYLKQCLLGIQLLVILIMNPSIKTVLCISGPGVDAAGLCLAALLKRRAVQLIQGPVSSGRLALKALFCAYATFYLKSAKPDLEHLLSKATLSDRRSFWSSAEAFQNGLNESQWPKTSRQEKPVVLWAASLLKWKGLPTLQNALVAKDIAPNLHAHICYIQPRHCAVERIVTPKNTVNTQCWEAPDNLDALRSYCSIFVSTSENEPFGLSILEAMAAGLCPVIPKDNAYWDLTLEHGVNCLKYSPKDAMALKNCLNELAENPQKMKLLGQNALHVAKRYTAANAYSDICQTLDTSADGLPAKNAS